jgi:hypothetical protein
MESRLEAMRRRRPDPPRRSRGRIAAGVFVALLSAAWLVSQHRPSSGAVPILVPTTVVTTPVSRNLANGIVLETWKLGAASAAARYRAEVGDVAPGTGAPACAHGRPDERAWSRPATPTVVAGRYRCVVEHGRAALWWTNDRGELAHAVGPNNDLAALFAWWRAFPGG